MVSGGAIDDAGCVLVLNGKGKGTRANPQFPTPDVALSDDSIAYTFGQLNGTITALPAEIEPVELMQLTRRVVRANNWSRASGRTQKYPPFKQSLPGQTDAGASVDG